MKEEMKMKACPVFPNASRTSFLQHDFSLSMVSRSSRHTVKCALPFNPTSALKKVVV